MRHVDKHPIVEVLNPPAERVTALRAWVDREVEDALAARQRQESVWREALKMYEGVPKNPIRNVPVENAPNTEITLGAIATDSIFAQAFDLIFNITPTLTCRPGSTADADLAARRKDAAKALQRFVDWGVHREWDFKAAARHTLFDDVQLGTGAFYIPFVESKKKTKVHRVTSRGPRVMTWPIEDVLLPGGAMQNLQTAKWVGLRWWLTEGELIDMATSKDWDVSQAQPIGALGWTRSRREQLGHTQTSAHATYLYEPWELYCYFDIDGDGYDEDLLVAWDHTSRHLLKIDYNPYDHRPLTSMVYQLRAHLWYGMGVMDMVRPFEEEATELHNQRTLNMLLANARFWKAKEGSVPETMRIWPGKVQIMQKPEDLDPVAMADVYPSSFHGEAIIMGLAERRVGVNEMSLPRPSAVLGSRTPGITALTMMQSVNRRFTPAFDAMREGCAAAVRQCLYRYQERLLAGDLEVEAHVHTVLGTADGQRVVDLLKTPDFDEEVSVELTASSVSVNKEADRQNALMLVNILAQYYQRTLELVALAANPSTPEEVRSVARKIAESAGEIIDRTIRTFDQMRDPEAFIVHVEEELDQIQGLSQQGMLGLSQMIGLMANGTGRMLGGVPGGGEETP